LFTFLVVRFGVGAAEVIYSGIKDRQNIAFEAPTEITALAKMGPQFSRDLDVQ